MPIATHAAQPAQTRLRLLCGAAAVTVLLGCAGTIRNPPPTGDLRILDIQPAQSQDAASPAQEQASLVQACRAWRLSAADAARFFALAREYPDGLGDGYYWLLCSIKGRLVADGRPWDFEINAAATAVWRDGDTVRRWGCSAPACAPLALLMPDDHNP